MSTRAESIDAEARELEDRVNARIAAEAPPWSHLEYRVRTEDICREMINSDRWEFMVRECIASHPRIAITQFKGKIV